MTLEELFGSVPTTAKDAFAIFDSAPIVEPDQMFGVWRGCSLPTGRWMDTGFEASGFWGKAFIDADTVHPLLFPTRDGKALWALSPARVPAAALKLRMRSERVPSLNGAPIAGVINALRPVVQTRDPGARLRKIVYRGKATATMIYDQLPIHDTFRWINQDALLGVTDIRNQLPVFFVLQRDNTLPLLAQLR